MPTVALDSGVRLTALTMVPDAEGVMVGRPDIGSYAVFPVEGAEVLRRLGDGATLGEVADWYERTCAGTLDLDDFMLTLDELGFTASVDEQRPERVVRWQRLGAAVFSWPAWMFYAVVVASALALMVRDPAARPSYKNIFFTTHLSFLPAALLAGTMPCILVHESFHALAGRRLGLPSTLRIGRRVVYIVAETRLDALLSVRRHKRYLPFLAGMLADIVVVSALTVLSVAMRDAGAARWLYGYLLAIAFTGVLRLLWQFLFYLETDLYFVASTLLGCTNLQSATRHLIADRYRRLLRRPLTEDLERFSPHDRRVAQWYAPVLFLGYAFSLATFFWAGLPTAVRIWSLAFNRIAHHSSTGVRADAIAFVVIEVIPLAILVTLSIRDLGARFGRGPAHRKASS